MASMNNVRRYDGHQVKARVYNTVPCSNIHTFCAYYTYFEYLGCSNIDRGEKKCT